MKTNPNVIDGVGKQFKDRREAGKILARELHAFANRSDAIVLALPRGGVPVGYEIAVALNLPLDSFEVRKLGVPGHEELAMGAIGSGGVRELSDEIISYLDIPPGEVVAAIEREGRELERRERLYRDQRPRPVIARRTVILVDDGLATGATMRVAVAALRKQSPARIVVAVPVAPFDVCTELHSVADDVACLQTPEPFYAVGVWYAQFDQVSDNEVRRLLTAAAQRHQL